VQCVCLFIYLTHACTRLGVFIRRLTHAAGFGSVAEFTGHGIGANFHTFPPIYHFADVFASFHVFFFLFKISTCNSCEFLKERRRVCVPITVICQEHWFVFTHVHLFFVSPYPFAHHIVCCLRMKTIARLSHFHGPCTRSLSFPGRDDIGVNMEPGMVFTIEPIISQLNANGQIPAFRILRDKWTVRRLCVCVYDELKDWQ
jgi:hypothetical protein